MVVSEARAASASACFSAAVTPNAGVGPRKKEAANKAPPPMNARLLSVMECSFNMVPPRLSMWRVRNKLTDMIP